MKATQLKKIIKAFGLTQQQAGDFLGYDKKSISRWLHGKLPVPRPVALLLFLMVDKHVTPEQAEKYIL